MVDLLSKKDIEKISYDILRSSGALDVFPTPVDKIVSYSELIVRKDVDISEVHAGFFSSANDVLRRALSKVRGMLDRREKTIYLDLSQKKERKNFVKLHEVGHQVLPWQAKMHDLLDDDDNSLNADTTEEFEAEANYFASITLFQHDRFNEELGKLPFGLDASMQLAKHFGASIHATLRRYIQCSNKRCGLLILENISPKGTFAKCNVRNVFESPKFIKSFGNIQIPEALGFTFPFVQDYYFGRRYKYDGVVELQTKDGLTKFNYHFFNNSYNAFVFLFPTGERNNSRTKIVLLENGQPFN